VELPALRRPGVEVHAEQHHRAGDVTRRRVARHGDGWNPFPAPPQLAKTARTTPLETLDDLAPLVDDLRRLTEAGGRDPASIDITWGTNEAGPAAPAFSPAAHLEAIGEMEALGITWCSVAVPGDSLDRAVEALERYGAEVIAPSQS
jgi:hypothetical protein